MPRILEHIVEQHAEEAAFLWLLRDKAVDAPHYAPRHLARLDERVEAHVDGLRVAGKAGCRIAWEQLQEHGEPTEMFAGAVTVVESGNPDLVAPYVDFATEHPGCLRGLVGAVAWTAPQHLGNFVQRWLDSNRPLERYLGISACSVHRVDPRERLAPLMMDAVPMVRARALRLVGELGRTDLAGQLSSILDADEEPTTRFWAAWSLALLSGSSQAVMVLQRISLSTAPQAEAAFDLALRALPIDEAKDWLRTLNGDPDRARQVVVGTGVIGDPVAVPWLVDRMFDPTLARVAGESLSMITGVDIDYWDLNVESPEGLAATHFRELTDEAIIPDPDEHLPWPAPEKVESWWQQNASRFVYGIRHLIGYPLQVDVGLKAWLSGYQRQRRAAAIELARLEHGDVLRSWRSKAVSVSD
jgi:uncharacterized protein (TIGR02270 family)